MSQFSRTVSPEFTLTAYRAETRARVSARATGTSINDQPEIELVLDVETPA